MSHDPATSTTLSNGSGAAAILAAGIGCFALGSIAVIADRSAGFKRFMNIYHPTGPLSGVTTMAIVLWLLSWALLEMRWKTRTVALGRVNAAAFALLALGLLLTFPPVADLF